MAKDDKPKKDRNNETRADRGNRRRQEQQQFDLPGTIRALREPIGIRQSRANSEEYSPFNPTGKGGITFKTAGTRAMEMGEAADRQGEQQKAMGDWVRNVGQPHMQRRAEARAVSPFHSAQPLPGGGQFMTDQQGSVVGIGGTNIPGAIPAINGMPVGNVKIPVNQQDAQLDRQNPGLVGQLMAMDQRNALGDKLSQFVDERFAPQIARQQRMADMLNRNRPSEDTQVEIPQEVVPPSVGAAAQAASSSWPQPYPDMPPIARDFTNFGEAVLGGGAGILDLINQFIVNPSLLYTGLGQGYDPNQNKEAVRRLFDQ